MKTKAPLAVFVIPVLLFGWILFSRIPSSGLPPSSIEAPREDFLAPSFILPSLDEAEIKLSELKGEPIILNFWASWCPPCRAEMPDFQEAYLEYKNTDLHIIAVNATRQDSLSGINSFLASIPVDFPILLDQDGTTTSTYQVHSLPTTFFIDRSGVIKKILIGGPIPLSLLRIEADRLLEE